jgi:hypothetical protein
MKKIEQLVEIGIPSDYVERIVITKGIVSKFITENEFESIKYQAIKDGVLADKINAFKTNMTISVPYDVASKIRLLAKKHTGNNISRMISNIITEYEL